MTELYSPTTRHMSYSEKDNASRLFVNAFGKAPLFIDHEKSDASGHGMTPPHDLEDAFAVYVNLRNLEGMDLWRDGFPVPTTAYPTGSVTIYDLRHDWRANIRDPFDCLHIHISRASLDEFADNIGARRICKLEASKDLATVDERAGQMARCLRSALEQPQSCNKLFIDHAVLALHAHLAVTYGGLEIALGPTRGGLAPWQARAAKELLSENLEDGVSILELASTCRLSPSHFSRAFRKTTGITPHRWLTMQRIERAKELLSHSHSSLADIALACGFADQSHFTRIFNCMIGAPPGAWQRARCTAGACPGAWQRGMDH